jgi:DNA-binding MarR family transcriptional regulator
MDRSKVPQDPWTQFALAVFQLNGLIIDAGERISRAGGQSSARWQVLGTVFEPRTVPDIARDLGISRQGVQRVADILETEGLLSKRPHPSDQRTTLLELTAAGREVMGAIYGRQVAWSNEILGGLNVEKLRLATTLMDEVAATLAAHSERQKG